MKNEFIKLSATLCAITLIAALLLAGVNSITEEKIALQEEETRVLSMEKLLSEADSFEVVDENVTAALSDGGVIGYCVNTTVKGFGGDINMLVGINNDSSLAGIDILTHSETAGLGAKADTKEFEESFTGKDVVLKIVKTKTERSDEVQAITGATITSSAIAKGIEDAFNQVQELMNGGGK
ncbi:MAG: FMN-binding protein [Clostridia bacterium]|nr:FMN-binding protein [Clostridia bacterium]